MPKIKWDARTGTLRYKYTFRGQTKSNFYTSRLGHCRRLLAEHILSETGFDHEVRIVGKKIWHPVTISKDEAREIILRSHPGRRAGEKHLASLEARAAKRRGVDA